MLVDTSEQPYQHDAGQAGAGSRRTRQIDAAGQRCRRNLMCRIQKGLANLHFNQRLMRGAIIIVNVH